MGKVAGYIPSQDFYIYASRKLDDLGRATIAYYSMLSHIDDFIEENTIPEHDSKNHLVAANFNTQPEGTQPTLVTYHDGMMSALDDILVQYGYFIKIHNFIPHLIAKNGEKHVYRDIFKSGVPMPTAKTEDNGTVSYDFCKATRAKANPLTFSQQQCEIDITRYLDTDSIFANMHHITKMAFSRIHELRAKFTPETWEARQENFNRDYFCARFLDNDEVEPHQVLSRIEYMFLKTMGIPLGVFEALPEVEKWMAEFRRDEKQCRLILDVMKDRTIQIMFPGLGLKQISSETGLGKEKIREISRNLRGIIPQTGIFIGDSPIKPKPSKPRLVHQSPR